MLIEQGAPWTGADRELLQRLIAESAPSKISMGRLRGYLSRSAPLATSADTFMLRNARDLLCLARDAGLDIELPRCGSCSEERPLVVTGQTGVRICHRCSLAESRRTDGALIHPAIAPLLRQGAPWTNLPSARLEAILMTTVPSRSAAGRLAAYLKRSGPLAVSRDPSMPRCAREFLLACRAAGIEVALPVCARCGEERRLPRITEDGRRLCSRCVSRERRAKRAAQPRRTPSDLLRDQGKPWTEIPLTDLDAIVASVFTTAQGQGRFRNIIEKCAPLAASARNDLPQGAQKVLLAVRERGLDVALPKCASCGEERLLDHTSPDGRICATCFSRESRAKKRARERAGMHPGTAILIDQGRPWTDVPAGQVEAFVVAVAPTTQGAGRLAAYLRAAPPLARSRDEEMPRAAQQLLRNAREAGLPVELPVCGHCGEERLLVQTGPDGRRLCGPCQQQLYAAPCSICNRHLPVTRRLGETQFCANCWRRDPRSRRHCTQCGRLRTTHSIIDGNPYCGVCVPKPEITCFICHKSRRLYSTRIGTGVCENCFHSATAYVRSCPDCGDKRVLAYAKGDRLVCASCAGAAPIFACSDCGRERTGRRVLCSRCDLTRRADELFSSAASGDARAALEPLSRYLLAEEQDPARLLRWMNRSTSIAILRRMLEGEIPLTHRALDALTEPPTAVQRVRALLEVAGCLSDKHDPWQSYEQWARALVEDAPAASREHLAIFTRWVVPATARVQVRRRGMTDSTLSRARERSRAALEFLQLLDSRNLTLDTATQSIFDEFALTSPLRALAVRKFIRWARDTGRIRRIALPAETKSAPSLAYSEEIYQYWISRFLNDPEIRDEARIVGLLVGLYAVPITRLAKLKEEHLTHRDGKTRLSVGSAPLILQEPVAELLHKQVEQRGAYAGGWMFPSPLFPGRHIDPSTLHRHLQQLGCETVRLRGAAMINLTATVPLGPLTELVGRSLSATGRWVNSSGGAYLSYPSLRGS